MKTFTCPTCATKYERKHGRQKYCKAACRPADKKVLRTCTVCGTDVYRAHSGTPRIHGFTCSPECHYEVTWGDRCMLPADHPARIKPKRETRSALRQAVDKGEPAEILMAIRDRCEIDATSGCWVWQGRLNKDGYPEQGFTGKRVGVHRLSLEAKLGASLGDQPAHHICATTSCVNPDHLQPVTHKENAAEMLARRYMERRIIALEAALRSTQPGHPLLAEVGLPSAA